MQLQASLHSYNINPGVTIPGITIDSSSLCIVLQFIMSIGEVDLETK